MRTNVGWRMQRASETKLVLAAMVCALGLVGCPADPVAPSDAGTDARVTDAPAATDAPVAADAPAAADAPSDAALADAPCACDAAEICVRGVCLAPCGAAAASLEAALAADLVPVAHYCRTPVAWSAVGDHVYEVAMRTEGTTTHFDLSRWTATPGTSAPTATLLGTASHTATMGEDVYPGAYVAVGSDEAHAVFGMTTSLAGFVGGVFDVTAGSGTVVRTDAPGNFDAVFVDATRVVVNGQGLATATGQGLYELVAGTMGGALVANGMGDSSGSLAYWASEDLIIAGGASYGAPFPTGESERVFFVSPTDLSATSPANLETDASFLAIPSAFWLVPGDGLVSVVWGASGVDHLDARWLAVSGTGLVSASTASALTNDGTFFSAGALAGDIGLRHAGGILVVRQVD